VRKVLGNVRSLFRFAVWCIVRVIYLGIFKKGAGREAGQYDTLFALLPPKQHFSVVRVV
jgi:hypothetical protein